MNLMQKISFYKKNGTLKIKIAATLKYRLNSFLISFPYRLIFARRSAENRIFYDNWKFYSVLKFRMRNTVRTLPPYSCPKKNAPKIIWWCWLQGEENAPNLCKACLESLRRNLSDFEIRVITEKNIWNYISVPDFIKEKYKNGTISRTHFSDILRTCLLVEHGGTWIDSTVYCTGYRNNVLTLPLFYFSNIKRGDDSILFSNWMISSCKAHPVLKAIQTLLFDYWKKHNRLYHYFIYHFFATMVLEHYPETGRTVPVFSNIPPHVMQDELFVSYSKERFAQYCLMSDFHKLTYKFDSGRDFTGTVYEYICKEAEKRETV